MGLLEELGSTVSSAIFNLLGFFAVEVLQHVTVRVHLDLGGNEQGVDLYLALVSLFLFLLVFFTGATSVNTSPSILIGAELSRLHTQEFRR